MKTRTATLVGLISVAALFAALLVLKGPELPRQPAPAELGGGGPETVASEAGVESQRPAPQANASRLQEPTTRPEDSEHRGPPVVSFRGDRLDPRELLHDPEGRHYLDALRQLCLRAEWRQTSENDPRLETALVKSLLDHCGELDAVADWLDDWTPLDDPELDELGVSVHAVVTARSPGCQAQAPSDPDQLARIDEQAWSIISTHPDLDVVRFAAVIYYSQERLIYRYASRVPRFVFQRTPDEFLTYSSYEVAAYVHCGLGAPCEGTYPSVIAECLLYPGCAVGTSLMDLLARRNSPDELAVFQEILEEVIAARRMHGLAEALPSAGVPAEQGKSAAN